MQVAPRNLKRYRGATILLDVADAADGRGGLVVFFCHQHLLVVGAKSVGPGHVGTGTSGIEEIAQDSERPVGTGEVIVNVEILVGRGNEVTKDRSLSDVTETVARRAIRIGINIGVNVIVHLITGDGWADGRCVFNGCGLELLVQAGLLAVLIVHHQFTVSIITK